MVTLLRPFRETFRIPADRKNYTNEIIEAMMILYPKILSDKPESLHSEVQISLNACNK